MSRHSDLARESAPWNCRQPGGAAGYQGAALVGAPWLAVLALAGSVTSADAQTGPDPRLEAELGAGYVIGTGPENGGHSLFAYNLALAGWPWARWGIALRAVHAPGDLPELTIDVAESTRFSNGRLRYWALTVRRRQTTAGLSWEYGFGIVPTGHYATVRRVDNTPRRSADVGVGGYVFEVFGTKAVGRHVAVKAGGTWIGSHETSFLQPVAAAVVRF
jgi:hypothetical protein